MSGDAAIDSADTSNGMACVVHWNEGVFLSLRPVEGRDAAVLHDEASGKYFHLGSEESIVASWVDGVRTLGEIHALLVKGGINWTADDVQAFVTLLLRVRLCDLRGPDGESLTPSPPRLSQRSLASVFQQISSRFGYVIQQRLPIGNTQWIVGKLSPTLGRLFSSSGYGVWFILLLAAIGTAWQQRGELAEQMRHLLDPSTWPMLIVLAVLIKAAHELGHAIAATRNGVEPGKFGITFFFLAPLPYVDMTQAWKLSDRWGRAQIGLGGIYFESWIVSIAMLMFPLVEGEWGRHFLTQAILIGGPASWLINANPLLRLDGYYVLSDLADIPNLRMRGRRAWGSWVDRHVLGISGPPVSLRGWRYPFAMTHAVLSTVFQFFWMFGILYTVACWTGVIGKVLAAVAVLVWGVLPLVMWCCQRWFLAGTEGGQRRLIRWRMLVRLGPVLLLVVAILSMRNPLAQSVPVVVRYSDEQVARAAFDGIVSEVLVQTNQSVVKGEVMMVMVSEDLQLRRDQLSDDLRMAATRYRQTLASGRVADADAAMGSQKQLQESLDELDQALAESKIVAARDGIVVSEIPALWKGRFAKKGETLVRVGDPEQKELLIAIPKDDFLIYQFAVQRGEALVSRLRGGERLEVMPQGARPRFSTRLPDAAFSAAQAGVLAVVPDASSSEGVRLASPTGTAIGTIVNPARDLRVGQRGRLYLNDDQTVLSRLWQWMTGASAPEFVAQD